MLDLLESYIRVLIIKVVSFLPVKIIRDDRGVPFLYRYHLLTLWKDGPGIYIHNFAKSDPGRGYHNHPWNKSFSFILCGCYEERILNGDRRTYEVKMRNRWSFNFLDGQKYHRVMVDEKNTAWTIFFHWNRCKTWSMVSLKGEESPMSTEVSDKDGGWWRDAKTGKSVFEHLELSGTIITTVDIVVLCKGDVLLIKRGKDPFKGMWAFPGGRVEPHDKNILQAARRELKEETNLDIQDLVFANIVSNDTRDPRGYCTTIVFVARLDEKPFETKAGDDAVDFLWFKVNKVPPMAFDHEDILKEVLLQ